MTKLGRIRDLITGIAMILMGLLLFINPEDNVQAVAGVFVITFTFRGIRAAHHYFTMGRHTIGGRQSLYRAMIYLDLALLTSEMSGNPIVYIIMYLAGLHFFLGLIDILRSFEAKELGSTSWKFSMASGVTNVLMGIAVLVAGPVFKSVNVVMYIYGAGLIYSAGIRIVSAFKRRAIVYIQ